MRALRAMSVAFVSLAIPFATEENFQPLFRERTESLETNHLNVLTCFLPDWGMLRRSRRILIFLKTYDNI